MKNSYKNRLETKTIDCVQIHNSSVSYYSFVIISDCCLKDYVINNMLLEYLVRSLQSITFHSEIKET